MAETTTPDTREWRRLYEATVRVKEISPWEWMTEADVFGVQNPETGELGFVSVMGMLGEHYAVSLYLGSEGIHGFLRPPGTGTLRGPGRPDPDPPTPGVIRGPRTTGQKRPRGHQRTGPEVQGTERLAVVPQLPYVLFPVVPGVRRGLFPVGRAGAVGGRGPALQGGLFLTGALRWRGLSAPRAAAGR